MPQVIRLMGRVAISGPPTLVILLSLLPADLIMLWLYGSGLALIALITLLPTILLSRRYRPSAFWQRARQQAIIALFIVVSVVVFNWPMGIAFALSRPALNQVAQQLLAGESFSTPRRVGLFRIEAAELSGGMMGDQHIPALWTDWAEPSDWMEGSSGDHMGFVQSGPGKPPFVMWSHMRLDHDWQFVYRAE
ncbi:MAG: hypothetical protein AAFU71_10455 [Cyanobacteria bacterium J06632_22]